MNWIQIRGNFMRFDGDIIRYIPAEDLSNFTHEKGGYLPFTGRIKASEFFESGTISFKLNIKEHQDAFFSVSLSNENLSISLNSGQTSKAFAIRARDTPGEFTIYNQNVDKGTLLLGNDYDITIQVKGSLVRLLVDKVQVCAATVNSIYRDQIILSVRSRGIVEIKGFKVNTERPKVFVVMQFSEEYNHLYSQVIRPVCEQFGYDCLRGDEYFTNGSILKDIVDAINESAIVIADITPNNPNVFYEVGYSHALNKPTILLSDKKRDKLPFDVSGFRTLFYDNTIAGKSEVEERLRSHLKSIQSN
jgi:hypothetical protein